MVFRSCPGELFLGESLVIARIEEETAIKRPVFGVGAWEQAATAVASPRLREGDHPGLATKRSGVESPLVCTSGARKTGETPCARLGQRPSAKVSKTAVRAGTGPRRGVPGEQWAATVFCRHCRRPEISSHDLPVPQRKHRNPSGQRSVNR